MVALKLDPQVDQSQLMISARVQVKNAAGQFVQCRALLDTCSTAHFVTENFVERLGLSPTPCAVPVGAISEMTTISNGLIELSFHSIRGDFYKTQSFLVVPMIANRVPSEVFPRDMFKIPRNIRLADPQFHLPQPVDMIIGSWTFLSMLSVGQIKLSSENCNLILQKTRLGWVASGKGAEARGAVSCELVELKRQIERFWILEDATAKQIESLDNRECEAHFVQHVTRDASGRYMVRLPFRSNQINLGNSRSTALRRFYSLQKRLNDNPVLREQYQRVMSEYIDLGHMSLVIDESEEGFYLPHHSVDKESSNTTKVRVVFDASAKTGKGVSLNDSLMVGPTIQLKLIGHLLRFRSHRYVITADIAKMYRQILMHPEDRRFQRIFWYHEGEIRVFQLNTVTFGVSAAPFLAIRTIHQLANDESSSFPLGSEVLKRDLYVDDLLTGANTYGELMRIRDQVIQVLKRGGFEIRQWSSNHPRALEKLNEKSGDIEFLTDENPVRKTLGISWNSRRDELIYTVKPIPKSEKTSKRYILSEISKIFDPLGLLAPILLASKVIMQECWKANISWDESVPLDLYTSWHSFARQLELIDHLTIERNVLIDDPIDIQIHGFCDASLIGYGACLYVRSRDQSGKVRVRLYCAKARVAPIGQPSDESPAIETTPNENVSSRQASGAILTADDTTGGISTKKTPVAKKRKLRHK